MKRLVTRRFSAATALSLWLIHLIIAQYLFTKGAYCEVYLWGALFMVLISTPYLISALTDKFTFYNPVHLFYIGMVFNYMSIMLLPLDEVSGIDPDLWIYVVKLVIIGAICFYLGYSLKLGRILAGKLPLNKFIIDEEKIFKLPPILYTVGWSIRIITRIYTSTIFSGWNIINVALGNSLYAAIMIDAYIYFNNEIVMSTGRRRRYLIRFLFFLLLQIGYSFIATGMRQDILYPIVLSVISYIKARKKIPYIAIGLLLVIIINFIMPYVIIYRNKHWGGESVRVSLQAGLEGISDPNARYQLWHATVKRISNSLYLAILCAEKREEGIEIKTYKDTLDYISRFVPRFLWPNKPCVDYNLVGRKLGIIGDGDYVTSVGLTLIAAFIISNGPLGVIFGMFIVGIILRTYWEWLMVRSKENLLAFIVYFELIYMWVRDEEFAISLHSNLSFLAYGAILLTLLKKRKKII